MPNVAEIVRQTRRVEFEKHQEPLSYITDRKFYDYDKLLPKWNKMTFSEILNKKVEESDTPVKVLDVGCGEGRIESGCYTSWEQAGKIIFDGIKPPPTDEKETWKEIMFKRQENMNIIHKDVQTKFADPDTYDIAVSVRVFEYLADPWKALKNVYRALKPNGIGLIHYFPFSLNLDNHWIESKALRDYLAEKYGMVFEEDFRIYNLSFCKTHANLQLPLSYTGKTHRELFGAPFTCNGMFEYNVLTYKLNIKID